jgi:hypothetical protein
MTSVKLGTCIHIVGKFSSVGDDSGGRLYEWKIGGGGKNHQADHNFDREFIVIPKHTQLSSQ